MRLVIAAIVLAGIAHAETPQDRARVMSLEGEKAFAKAEYAVAAKKFDGAYRLDADPAYLLNSAKAYFRADQCAVSVERFRELLRIAAFAAQQRAEVDGMLQQADDCAKKRPAPAPQPALEPAVPETTQPFVGEPREEQPASKRGRRIAGLAIAGVGLVAVGAGVFYTLDVKSLQSDRDAVCPTGCTWDDMKHAQAERLEDAGARSEKIAIGAYVAGGLALAGGVALYLTSKDERRSVAIVPTASGAAVFARF